MDQEKMEKMLGGLLYVLEKANTNLQSLDVDWEVLKPLGLTAATYTGWWRANKTRVQKLMREDIQLMDKALEAWVASTRKVFESPDDPMSVALALNNSMNYPGVVVAVQRKKVKVPDNAKVSPCVLVLSTAVNRPMWLNAEAFLKRKVYSRADFLPFTVEQEYFRTIWAIEALNRGIELSDVEVNLNHELFEFKTVDTIQEVVPKEKPDASPKKSSTKKPSRPIKED
jgi:hypothetical protein